MKPDFENLSRQELRAYVLAHRDDLDALDALYHRRTPDSEAVWFYPPKTQKEEQQQFELFKRLISEKSHSDNSAA